MNNDLYQMLTNSADGALVVGGDQRIIYWNKAATKILGYKPEEVNGRPCYQILSGGEVGVRQTCLQHCAAAQICPGGKPVRDFDLCVRTHSGARRWINISTLTGYSINGPSQPEIVHLFRDVTQNKRMEQLLYQVSEAAKNLQDIDAALAPPETSDNGLGSDLTKREREVLSLIVEGLTTSDIADALIVSPATVRNHIRHILRKLQVHSRLEAALYAVRHGYAR